MRLARLKMIAFTNYFPSVNNNSAYHRIGIGQPFCLNSQFETSSHEFDVAFLLHFHENAKFDLWVTIYKQLKILGFISGKNFQEFILIHEIKAITNIIIRSVTGVTKGHQLYLTDHEVTGEQASIIDRICLELKTGKPVQYILGETIFYECRIKLNSSTLIPRPETEELVDLVIRENRGYYGNIIDFATGSGCIAIAIASKLSGTNVTGTDISDDALTIARENARINNVEITWLKDDILTPDTGALEKAGIIVSNPPYVRNSEKQMMNKNVLDFEPHSALFVADSDPLVLLQGYTQKGS